MCEKLAVHASTTTPQRAGAVDPLDAVAKEAFAKVSARCVSGLELDARVRNSPSLSTGSRLIDGLLGGGLRRGELVEVCGPPAVGKTQLCLSASSAVARSGQEVLFVDATGGFSVSRLAQLAQQEAATAEAQRRALESVCCVKAFDVHEALRLLDGLLRGGGGSFAARPRPALLVFDSVSALLSPLLTTKHSQGHALMLSLAGALRALADEHNVAVLLTNHTVSGRDGEEGSLKPALGETWKSQPHLRLQLSAGPLSGVEGRQVNSAMVTLGRGRGRSCSYTVAASGLMPA